MDKFKAFIADKKNQPIVAAVAVIVMVVVVLFYLKQFGIIGGSQNTAPMDMGTDTGTTAPTSGSVPPATPTDVPTTGTQTPTPPPAQASLAKMPPMFAYRKDPFMGFSGPPKRSDALMAILPGLQHVRLAPATVGPLPGPGGQMPEVLPPQPMRRVAGIMWGSRVRAIIESGGKTYVVSPGEQIPDERVRVESIEPSGVILTTLDTRVPMRIRVNLAGSPEAQAQGNAVDTGNQTGPQPNNNRPRPRPGSGDIPYEGASARVLARLGDSGLN